MSSKITKTFVDGLDAATSAGKFFWDSSLKGFGVRVNANGSKTFLIQYRMGGRGAATKRMTIGHHGSPWTVEAARAEAKKRLALVDLGTDPAQLEVVHDQKYTLQQAVDEFRDVYLKTEWARTWKNADSWNRRIWNAKQLKSNVSLIQDTDIHNILERYRQQQASRRFIYALLSVFFGWLKEKKKIASSPLEVVRAPRPARARERVLQPPEVWLLWHASLDLGYPFCDFVRLALLTAQRRSTVIAAEVSELQLIDDPRAENLGVWEIPAAKMKTGVTHRVPLAGKAREIMRSLSSAKSGLLFTTNGTTPASGFSKTKARLDSKMAELLGAPLEHWVWHDLRRTVATAMQSFGFAVEVTEAVLAHISGSTGGIVGVYNKYRYEPEKRLALTKWNDCIQSIIRIPNLKDVPSRWEYFSKRVDFIDNDVDVVAHQFTPTSTKSPYYSELFSPSSKLSFGSDQGRPSDSMITGNWPRL